MFNTLYDLSIDKALNEFARDGEAAACAMEVFKKPLKTPEEIKYRQDILLDFIEMPKLLDELRTIFANYDTLQSEWRELRSGIYVYGVPNTSGGILDATYESVKITAAFARKTVSYFRSIYDAVDKYPVKSGAHGHKAILLRNDRQRFAGRNREHSLHVHAGYGSRLSIQGAGGNRRYADDKSRKPGRNHRERGKELFALR
jgi:hypothetical protein